jgi:hypothetical protein
METSWFTYFQEVLDTNIRKFMAMNFLDLDRILFMGYMPHITGDAYAAVLQNLKALKEHDKGCPTSS